MIEFYGDSFSADTHGWPSILATKLSSDLNNHSVSASSITETIVSLKDKDSFGDIVCITVSSPDRIYHPNYLIHYSLAGDRPAITLAGDRPAIMPRGLVNPPTKELESAVKYYYTYLENDINRNIRYECQFNWMLNLTNNHPNTKFILIPCFENSDIVCEKFNAIITSPVLIDIWKSNSRSMPDVNHLTIKQNKQFADQIYKLLVEYDANKSKTVKISFK